MTEREEENTLGVEELAHVEGGATVRLGALTLRAHVDNPGQTPLSNPALAIRRLSLALAGPSGLAIDEGTFPIGTIAPRGHQREESEVSAQTEPARAPESTAAAPEPAGDRRPPR